MTQTLITIQKNVKPILSKGQSIKITDEPSLREANEILSLANTKLKEITALRKEDCAPYKQKINDIEVVYEPAEDALSALIKDIRGQMSAYQTEQLRIQQAEEEKIAAKAAKGTIRLDTAVRKMDEVEKPVAKVVGAAGSLRFRADKKLKIVNEKLIPRPFLVPNEALILEHLKAGTPVPGCEIEIVQIPINTRN